MNEESKKRTLPYWRKSNSLHFSIGLVLSLMLVVTAFNWNFRNELTETPVNSIIPSQTSEIELIVVEEPIPARPRVPKAINVDIFTDPTEPDETVDIPVEFIEVPVTTDVPELGDLFGDHPEGKEETEEVVYELIPASPQEGSEAFYAYLYKKIRYPIHLSSRNISGKVEVSFVVDENGKITDVKILKGFDKALEKEIIRVLENSPEWYPAQLGANKVRTQHKIPFSFDLQ